MCTEIEAKLKVDSLREIKRKLSELGAEFLEERLQKDYYFEDANTTLIKTDRCLRLRREVIGEKERIFLTYKGAKEKDAFKKRREIEIEVGDCDSAEELLLALGYKRALILEKKRRNWRFGGCVVALDQLPLLGDFVEIEGPDDKKIAEVQSGLGLTDSPHIGEGYAFLMKKELDRKRQD